MLADASTTNTTRRPAEPKPKKLALPDPPPRLEPPAPSPSAVGPFWPIAAPTISARPPRERESLNHCDPSGWAFTARRTRDERLSGPPTDEGPSARPCASPLGAASDLFSAAAGDNSTRRA